MTVSTKLFLKGIAACALLTVILVSVFVAKTIFDAPLGAFDQLNESGKPQEVERVGLERGSAVSKEHLENYLLFAEGNENLKTWKAKNQKSLKEIKNGLIYLEDNLFIPPPLVNDCPIVYCFQKRLRFENIPPIFWKGLIGIEDERFLNHKGIDFKSLLRALVHDIKVMRLEQGGSTLTQQIVKNLFYSNEKKFSRKFKEMILAVYLESKYEKEKILEAYFNEVIWGGKQSVKIRGLYSASIFYFFKKPERIEPYEAAILIALLKGPNFYNPLTKQKRLKDRADLVYRKLVKMNLFPPEQDKTWDDKKWQRWVESLRKKQELKPYRINWWLSNDLEKAELGIYEKYVLKLQVKEILEKAQSKTGKKDIAVKAYFGNLEKGSEYFYYSKYERDWKKALEDEKHILGSTIKPLIYSILVDLGSNLETEVETGPLELNLKSGPWRPREAHSIPEKWITLASALKKSYNRPLIREVMAKGFESVELKMVEMFPSLKRPLVEYPAQLLGSIEVSIKDLFNVYKDFIKKECKKDPEESVVTLMSNPKETTIRRLVGNDFGNLRFFHKTGTSNNGFDNWFIFYEGNRLGVIWVGLEGPRTDKDLNLYGGTTSFKIFKEFYLKSGKRFGELICNEASLTN